MKIWTPIALYISLLKVGASATNDVLDDVHHHTTTTAIGKTRKLVGKISQYTSFRPAGPASSLKKGLKPYLLTSALFEKNPRISTGKNLRNRQPERTTGGSVQNRIVGGEFANVGDYPYFVDLRGCGGSLIAPQVVLTASHCDPGGSFYVGQQALVGAFERQQETNGAIFVRINGQQNHPQYDIQTFANDFMLIRLERPVVKGAPTLRISRDDTFNSPAPGTLVTVMGVGKTSAGGTQASSLKDVVVPVIDVDVCNQKYEVEGGVETDVSICAGDTENGGIDSCQGDSGGPMIIIDENDPNHHLQVGVVSFGVGCADKDFPGVYAKVGSAFNWIQDTVCNDWGLPAEFCDGNSSKRGNATCGSDEMDVDFWFETDGFGDDTSWDLVSSNGTVIDGGDSYNSATNYMFENCVPTNDCYSLTLHDAFGDGFCCGGVNPGFGLIVDGLPVFAVGNQNFESFIKFQFGQCGVGKGRGERSCGENEYEVSIHLQTDEQGFETSWKILNARNEVFGSGEKLESNTTYTETFCVPKVDNSCYTFIVHDSGGDGFADTAGAGFVVSVDGEIIGDSDDASKNFGSSISQVFGTCHVCARVSLEVQTDAFGEEITVAFEDDKGNIIFAQNGFGANSHATFEAPCVDLTGCSQLSLTANDDNGLRNGKIKLTINGVIIFDGSSFQEGMVFPIGDACEL